MGAFTKTVTVTYDSVERPVILFIKGKVDTAPANDNSNFPNVQGALAFDKKVVIYTDDARQKDKSFTINGNVNRVYSEEEKAKMPHIEFESLTYDGGTVLEGEKVTHAFVFRNTGKSDLVLENVKASCGCTATAPMDKVIKTGQTS